MGTWPLLHFWPNRGGAAKRNRLVADSTETQEEQNEEKTSQWEEEKAAILAKRDEALAEAKRAKALAAKYKDVDPDEYRSLKQQAAEAAQKKAIEEGNLESWKKQFQDQFAKEKEPLVNENKNLRSALERRLVDAEATAALAAAKGKTKVLLPHIKASVKVVEEDGEFVVQVVDSKGNPRIGDAKGNLMTISQLVEELKSDPEFAQNFEGTGSSGGGASRSIASGVGGSRTVSMSDNDALLANMDGILKGTVKVTQ